MASASGIIIGMNVELKYGGPTETLPASIASRNSGIERAEEDGGGGGGQQQVVQHQARLRG